MFRNLALLRSGVVMNSANGGQKYLSTRQHPRKRDSLFDQDNYPSENGIVRSSPFENITVPNLTIDQYVWNNFREWETKIATVSELALNLRTNVFLRKELRKDLVSYSELKKSH